MNTLMNEIFQENSAPVNGRMQGQQYGKNSQQEIRFFTDTIEQLELNPEQEFEFWDKLKRKARNIAAAIMLSRDALRQRKLEDYRRQGAAITQDINKDKSADKPRNEMSMMQEIFLEAEGEMNGRKDLSIESDIDEDDLKLHRKKRPSAEEKHQKGKRRKLMDRKGGEKGDARRPYQR